MARFLATVMVLVLSAAACAGFTDTGNSTLVPKTITVVAYNGNSLNSAGLGVQLNKCGCDPTQLCPVDTGPNDPCFSVLNAGIGGGDVLQATFVAKTGVDDSTWAKYTVLLCFAKTATINRKWRKANTIIKSDKSCPFIMGTGTYTPGQGTITVNYAIPDPVPTATYYVKVLVQNAGSVTYVGWGNTQSLTNGFFTVNGINPVSPAMKIAVAILSFSAGMIPIGYAAVSWMYMKNE